jgi:TP901 family phage tail tape measure protein
VARYGSGSEDFEAEAARLKALAEKRAALVAREGLYQRELEATGAAEDKSVRRTQVRRRARREAQEVVEREVQVSGKSAKAIDADTNAIQRNTEARRRNAEVAKRQAVDVSRALRGANDPLFSRAQAQPTIAAQGRALGVGGTRAKNIQEALTAGFTPSSGYAKPAGPITRLQGLQVAAERAEAEYAAATRHLTNTRRRASATDADRLAAAERREAARTSREAARIELESAKQRQASSADASAADREVARSDRARAASTALIRHPELFGRGSTVEGSSGGDYSTLQPRGRPGVISEGGPGHGGGRSGFAQEAAGINAVTTAQGRAATAANAYRQALDPDVRERVDALYKRNARSAELEAARTNAVAQANRNAGASFSTVSQAMHRHGALTSEFILAAARGETTLRELGNQAVVTAGKFGGWTLAASALYGAARAIGQVGTGAIKSSAGVKQLQRVIPNAPNDETQAAFTQLSKQFNVPIDTASDAVYRMGQRFHNLPDAVKAAQASLYSFKTGEVDVATSTENLIAIVNGFGLGADDLSRVYDQINQAQNTFGIRIGDTEAGLAKAAGTYRNAGGDLNYLLAVMTAIGRATNRSGQEIGTGIARGVNEIRKPINQEKLRSQGVEADPQNFQKTLQSALQAAKRDGADLQKIASGLFGNQYARLIAPVLKDQTTLNQALQDTSPAASQGSAQRELAKVLSQVDEKIQAIGNSLQRLGAALGRAGVFTPIGAALNLLLGVLNTTNSIIEAFDKLPAPIRQSLVLLGEMALAIRLIRRFGGGERLAGGPLGFLSSPDQALKVRATKGLRGFRDESFNIQESAGAAHVRARFAADQANIEANRLRRSLQADERSGKVIPYSPTHINRGVEVAKADARAADLSSRAAVAERELESARLISARATKQLTEVEALRAAQVPAYLRKQNVAVPRELDAPNTRGVGTVADDFGEGPQGRLFDPSKINQLNDPKALSRRGKALERSLNKLGADMIAGTQGLTGMGTAAGNLVQRSAPTFARGLSAAERGLERIRSVPGRLGPGIRNFAAALGPLDVAIFGYLAGSAISNMANGLQKDLDDAERFLHDYRGQSREANRKLDIQANRLKEGQTGTQYRHDSLTQLNQFFNPVELLGHTIPNAIKDGYESPAARRARVGLESAQEQQNLRLRRENQTNANQRGVARPQLIYSDLIRDIDKDARARSDGIISQREFDKRMGRRAIEAKTLFEPSEQHLREVAIALAAAGRVGSRGGYRAALRGLDEKGLTAEIEASTTNIQTFGANARNMDRLRSGYDEAVRRWAGRAGPKSIASLAKAREAYFKGVEESVQTELQDALRNAPSEGARQDAYGAAAGTYRKAIAQSRQRVRQAQARLARAEREFASAQPGAVDGPIPGGRGGDHNLQGDPIARRSTVDQDRQRIQQLKASRTRLRSELAAAERRLQRDLEELRDTAYDDRQAGRQINLALANARTGDPGRQAANAIKTARSQLADATRHYGTSSRQYRQALTELFNAQQQQAQSILANVEANNALMVARAGTDPINSARAQVNAARNTANAVSKDKFSSPADKTNAQANLINAQNALADAQRQQAQEIASLLGQIEQARAKGDPVRSAQIAKRLAERAKRAARNPTERLQAILDFINANNDLEDAVQDREQARYEFLASQTTDPVKKAAIDVSAARRAVANAKKGTAEWYRAKAKYNEARQAQIEANISDSRDDIEFDLEFNKITRDQAIKQLEALLKTKGLSKATRRDIQRRIKALKDEGEQQASGFDLDVGNIKLPTVYDVRRAFDPIRKAVKANHDAVKQQQRAINQTAVTGADGSALPVGIGNEITNTLTQRADTIAQIEATINIYPQEHGAEAAVYKALDTALGTKIRAKMRTQGHRARTGVHR